MSSSGWHALGTGDVLGYLRADLRRAKVQALVVGPWIDAFFADIVADELPASVELRVVTRPLEGTSEWFAAHAQAARAIFDARSRTLTRLHASLHAKVIAVDEAIVYCGSANWYRYSLEESREIVLRGTVADVPSILDELQVIWDQASAATMSVAPKRRDLSEGCREEVIDPIAAAKLKQVRGAFVLETPPKKGQRR